MCHAAVSSVQIPLACRVSNRTNFSTNRFFDRGEGLVFVSAMPLRNTDAKRPGMHSNAKRWNEEVMRGRNKSQAPWRQADGPMQKAQKVAYPGSAVFHGGAAPSERHRAAVEDGATGVRQAFSPEGRPSSAQIETIQLFRAASRISSARLRMSSKLSASRKYKASFSICSVVKPSKIGDMD